MNHGCPTHYWPNAEPSLIDFVLSKNRERIKCFFHYSLIPSTHHDLLFISYKFKFKFNHNNKPTKFSFRDYSKISSNDLSLALESIEWNEFYDVNDINDKVNIFNYQFFNIFNECVPLTEVKLKCSRKSWFTTELNQMLKIRKVKYDIFKSTPNTNVIA